MKSVYIRRSATTIAAALPILLATTSSNVWAAGVSAAKPLPLTGRASSALQATEAVKKTVRLLSIGNSFSGNATTYLDDLAKADGNTLIFRHDSIPGGTLQQHWEKLKRHEADPKAAAGLYSAGHSLDTDLTAQPWDFVTIQQASIKSHDPATYHPYAENLLAYIRQRAPRATVLIHETWAYRRDDPRFAHPEKATGIEPGTQKMMYDELDAAYDALAKGLGGLRIIPVGDAFYRADTDPTWGYQSNLAFDPKTLTYPTPPPQLHSLHRGWYWATLNVPAPVLKQDGHHASTAGQYLAGCVWYEVLFGKSAVGNTFIPKNLDPAYARFLQETAHAAVIARQ